MVGQDLPEPISLWRQLPLYYRKIVQVVSMNQELYVELFEDPFKYSTGSPQRKLLEDVMPNFKAHIGIGFITTLVLFSLIIHYNVHLDFSFSVDNLVLLGKIGFIIFLYALLPDIDHQNSKIRFFFTVVGLILILYFAYIENMTLVISIVIGLLVVWLLPKVKGWGHRGHFHDYWIVLLLALPIGFIFEGWLFYIAGILNYWSHIFADKFYSKAKGKWI